MRDRSHDSSCIEQILQGAISHSKRMNECLMTPKLLGVGQWYLFLEDFITVGLAIATSLVEVKVCTTQIISHHLPKSSHYYLPSKSPHGCKSWGIFHHISATPASAHCHSNDSSVKRTCPQWCGVQQLCCQWCCVRMVQHRVFLVPGPAPGISIDGISIDGIIQAMGGGSCLGCRLKSVSQVKEVNLPILVAGSNMSWTRVGSVTCGASFL